MPDSPARISLATPQDVLSAVPHLLGFRPADSLVIIPATASNKVPAVLRYDLPGPGDAPALTRSLPAVLGRLRADAVVLAGYGEAGRARPALDAVIASLRDLLTITAALLVTGSRYWCVLCDDCCPSEGVAIDTATVASVQFTVTGSAPLPSRDHMIASIVPDPAAVRSVRAAVARAVHRAPAAPAAGPDTRHLDLLRQLIARAAPLSDDDAALLLLLLLSVRLRDEAFSQARSADPVALTAFWTDLTRRAPAAYAAAPASLLAYSAARSGNGALARAAAEQALAARRGYTMARLLLVAIDAGLPPSEYQVIPAPGELPPVPPPPAS